MLKLDLHTHLKVSKRTPLQPGEARRFGSMARERGLDGLAVTEHFHAPGFWLMYDELLQNHVYRRGRFETADALMYSGAELTLDEGVDLVLLAPLQDLRALDRAFRLRLSCGYHPTAEEFLDASERLESPVVTILAHPFGHARGADAMGPRAFADLIDAVEINARFVGEPEVRDTERLAQRHGLATTGGSDAHVHVQVGAAHTELAVEGDGFEDLAQAIRKCSTRAVVRADAAAICREGRDRKKELKAVLPKLPGHAPAQVAAPVVA